MSEHPRNANPRRVGEIDRRSLMPFLGAGAAFLMLAGKALAQQYPLPKTAADVPGRAPGATMTKAYAQSVARTAYLWGWPLVNMANRGATFAKAPEPILLGGVVPVSFGRNAMLTDYVSPEEKFVTCPNQDVVYGGGFFALNKEPAVVQVPDFGDRFWVYPLYDARTDEFSELGKQYGTKPGFYMVVGPDWQGEKPAGISAIVRSSTALIFAIPRIFMNDTPEDHAAIQPVISQVVFYPLSEFDGKMKTKDWSKLPVVPAPESKGETRWVNPETFFDELPMVMKSVPPLPGEEALYSWIGSVLEAAAKDPEIKQALKEAAVAAERDLVDPLFLWRNNGGPAGNGWNAMTNAAQFGTDYLNRAAMAKASMFGNRPNETKYFDTDDDSQGKQLSGDNAYSVTFAKEELPPVQGFWSLTLYNELHLFNPNPLKRYSLGTKNKDALKFNADGSLTLYASAKSPGADKESNWLPAAGGTFSLFLRTYWPDKAVLDGSWTPPKVEIVK